VAFLIDSMPVPVRRRARARRCRTVRGRDCCGFCAAKREQFFGWRRHLSCTTGGLHDLTPVHELPDGRRPAGGGGVYGDKGYNGEADEATILADTGVRLVPIRTANMRPNRWADTLALRAYRKRIEAPLGLPRVCGSPALSMLNR